MQRKDLTSRFAAACMMLVLSLIAPTFAADRLIDLEPHDLITLPDEKDSKQDRVVKIHPVKLPGRKIPADRKDNDKIRIRIVDDEEDKQYEVQWKDVRKLELYEVRVLKEAEKLSAERKFDEAYDFYAFLMREYPNVEGLKESIQAYWYLNAAVAFREKRYDEALAVLEELLRTNREFKLSEKSPPLTRVLGEITDKLVQRYVDQEDFRSARSLLARLAEAYDAREEAFYTKWRDTLETRAAVKLKEAKEHLAAGRFTEAYDANAAMVGIWPEVKGGRELAAEITRRYPRAIIAVTEPAVAPDSIRIDRWASRRSGRLTDRRLIEFVGLGPEGGQYRCTLGTCERSDDGRQLLFTLDAVAKSEERTGYELSQLLLGRARPDSALFSRQWADVAGGVAMPRPDVVEAALKRPHVLPQALLQFSLAGEEGAGISAGAISGGVFQMLPAANNQTRFALKSAAATSDGRPREIVEQTILDPEAVFMGLQRGTIDAVDRVVPTDVERMRGISGVTVQRYAVPTVHVLVPNTQRPWPAGRTFRRAISYALPRDLILREGLLRGAKIAGSRLISGPVPAPTADGEPLSYAYDSKIAPPAYEPLLAVALLSMAKSEALATARSKNQPPPKFEGITLGHPASETARIACRAIAQRLQPLGVPCKLIELEPSESMRADCDFVYAEWVITEPVIDVVRLFGPGGPINVDSPYLRLAIKRVESARNWNEAGERLRELHRAVSDDLTVLPLWQLVEHYAYRRTLTGFESGSVTLYQDVEKWRIASDGEAR